MIVYDQTGWQRYLELVRADDLRVQQTGLDERLRDPASGPLDKKRWITPFPYVSGYDWRCDKPRWADTPMPGDTPERNDVRVQRDDRVIARLIGFDVIQQGFGYSPLLSCSSRFPEVYRIARTKVLA